MQQANQALIPLLLGVLAGALALGTALYAARRILARSEAKVRQVLDEARRDAEDKKKELVVATQEKMLALEEEADRRERELEERETQVENRARKLDRDTSELGRERKLIERRRSEAERLELSAAEAMKTAEADQQAARDNLERVAGLTAAQARDEMLGGIADAARAEGAKIARRIEDEARQGADRAAKNMIVQASQRVNIRDVMESTVSFIELPNDEMKGRIIGKEGRNIRALEMATGIDLIVDDTPRSIWISSFDPMRREIARVAIDQLLEDGRIHPARIEEAVERVTEEIETLIEEKGNEAAFSLGISDLNPKLLRLIGKARYYTSHGQNLLRHSLETAMIAGFMAQDLGGSVEIAQRAGLLHEIGTVADDVANHAILLSAELSAKYQEAEEVVEAIRSLHAEVPATALESILLNTANRLSENRPGARKENLAVFIERLRRLEGIASQFPGVRKAFAVKAGKELRIILDAGKTNDQGAYKLSKEVARAVERELSYPGQIKVSVVRETRAVRFAV